MKVFVAGATGAIGRPLVRQLLEAGHEVSAITRSERRATSLREQGVDAHVGDALDRPRLSDILEATRPEVLVHQLTTFPETLRPIRTVKEWRQTLRLRVEGIRLFADLAARIGVRRVVAQSIAFGYKPVVRGKATEEDPFYGHGSRAMDLFMRHLLRVEEVVMSIDGVEGVALRYGGWYGPGTHFDRGGLVYRLAMKRRIPVLKGSQGVWNAIHVDDAASATVASLSGPTGVFNVVEDEPMTWSGFVSAYCSSIGAPTPRKLPSWTMTFGGFYLRHQALHQVPVANEKARRELEWKPRYPTAADGFGSWFANASRP